MSTARNLPPDDTDRATSWAETHLEAWRIAKSQYVKKRGVDHESGWLLSYADLMTLLVGFFALLLSLSTMEPKKFEEVKKVTTEQFGGAYEKPFAKLAASLQESITHGGLGDLVTIETDDSGVTLTFRDSVFFDVGSADIKDQARTVLHRLIGATLTQTDDFQVVVEGHTDSTPLRSKEFTNWELSGIRAARVVRAFIEEGFQATRMQGVGFGDTRPLARELDDMNTPIPMNQARNRRVVIHLIKDFKKNSAAKSAPKAVPAAASEPATASAPAPVIEPEAAPIPEPATVAPAEPTAEPATN